MTRGSVRVSHHSLLWAALAATVVVGCTDAPLIKIIDDSLPFFDNELRVTGKFCTSDPSDLEFPLKVLFVIDTSQSMNNNDPQDPAETDLTKKTGRSRAMRDVINQFIDLGLSYVGYCDTGAAGCEIGKPGGCQPACQATEMCVGPRCRRAGDPWDGGLPQCTGALNGRCLQLCDNTKVGCGLNDKGCADCANPNDRCINGLCGNIIDPGVKFAAIRFGSAKQVLTTDVNGDEGFTNDPAALVTALPQVNNGGSVTDYEGALAEAFKLLSSDMQKARDEGSTAVNRSKYVVIFLSDGQPDPQVNGQSDWRNMDPNIRNDLLQNNPGGVISKYNVPQAILRRVQDIKSLKAIYRVGSIQLHTAFLSAPDMPGWKQEQAVALLKQMADIGDGTFRNFRNGAEINYLHVDFSSLRRVFKLKNFIVTNINGRPYGGGVIVDSDGDGIDDRTEELAGSSPAKLDTDGDGFSDTLEHFFRQSGWDPLDPTDADCSLRGNDANGDGIPDDTDGDGLRDCEERFIGTNRNLFDTDGDGIPDGLEVRFGTNPVANDALADLDFDGMPNGDEIRLHTDPRADDAAHRSRASYRYDVVRVGNGIEYLPVPCSADPDCPTQAGCRDGFCRCTQTSACSSGKSCNNDGDCPLGGERCISNLCTGPLVCAVAPAAAGPDPQNPLSSCSQKRHISCYTFDVENIQLLTPRPTENQTESGWNTIYLYFGEAPFDNPDGQGNFKVACVKSRYNYRTGAKLPATGVVAVPDEAWKAPPELNPKTDCVCPDGKIGSCGGAPPAPPVVGP